MDGATTHDVIIAGGGDVIDGGNAGEDAVDINSITFTDINIQAFPMTSKITRIVLQLDGIHIEHTNRWIDVRPPGWKGFVCQSLGIGENINGHWYAGAPMEMYYGMDHQGGQIQSQNVENSGIGQIAKNWFYDNRWGPLAGRRVNPGEEILVYLTSGSVRNKTFTRNEPDEPVVTQMERSNIVKIKLPNPGEVVEIKFK
jgi:hypothetical protein